MADADAEGQAAACGGVRGQCLTGQCQWMLGVGDDDSGAQPDAAGAAGRDGQGGEHVPRRHPGHRWQLRHPCPVKAGSVGGDHGFDGRVEAVRGVRGGARIRDGHDRKTHALLPEIGCGDSLR
nr:hypothetical protein [Mycolicibacterium septicum]